MILARRGRGWMALGLAGALAVAASAEAGGGVRHGARGRVLVPTAAARPVRVDGAPTPMRGSFYSTPYVTIRGGWPTGGGYSPLEQYGNQTLALDGPLSPFRTNVAPVLVYTRGYYGEVRSTVGASSSYPNLPTLSPVVYPTHANSFYFGARRPQGTPPWWQDGSNWVDMN